MAVRLISAVRQSNRNAIRMTITSTQPIARRVRQVVERPLDERGRAEDGRVDLDVLQRRLAASPAPASTPRVTSSVLPSGCFSTISSRPGPSLMTASPIGGGEPMATSATSPSRSGAPPRKSTTVARQVVRLEDRREVPDGQPLVRRVDEAARLQRRRVAGGLARPRRA